MTGGILDRMLAGKYPGEIHIQASNEVSRLADDELRRVSLAAGALHRVALCEMQQRGLTGSNGVTVPDGRAHLS